MVTENDICGFILIHICSTQSHTHREHSTIFRKEILQNNVGGMTEGLIESLLISLSGKTSMEAAYCEKCELANEVFIPATNAILLKCGIKPSADPLKKKNSTRKWKAVLL